MDAWTIRFAVGVDRGVFKCVYLGGTRRDINGRHWYARGAFAVVTFFARFVVGWETWYGCSDWAIEATWWGGDPSIEIRDWRCIDVCCSLWMKHKLIELFKRIKLRIFNAILFHKCMKYERRPYEIKADIKKTILNYADEQQNKRTNIYENEYKTCFH